MVTFIPEDISHITGMLVLNSRGDISVRLNCCIISTTKNNNKNVRVCYAPLSSRPIYACIIISIANLLNADWLEELVQLGEFITYSDNWNRNSPIGSYIHNH
jgi:hypothetical protein